jgi:hypothetical protein
MGETVARGAAAGHRMDAGSSPVLGRLVRHKSRRAGVRSVGLGQAPVMEVTTEDRVAQFVVMLGACCDAARLARLRVRVELDDGSEVVGVPAERAEARDHDEEFDHSGTREWLTLGQTVVMTARVRSYGVFGPDAGCEHDER